MDKLDDKLSFSTDLNKRLLYSKWLAPVIGEEYRLHMQRLYEQIDQHNIAFWLHDSTYSTLLSLHDQKWLTEMLGLFLAQSSLKQLAIIAPQEEARRSQLASLRDKSYRIYGTFKRVEMFDATADAIAWLLPHLAFYKLPPLPGTKADTAG